MSRVAITGGAALKRDCRPQAVLAICSEVVRSIEGSAEVGLQCSPKPRPDLIGAVLEVGDGR